MRRQFRSLVLLVVLGSSVACAAGIRVYDEPHRDYHRWDAREDRAYRVYLSEQHRNYREFSRLERPEQDQYWAWRHSHPDTDRERR
ncbi:MAG TPA: hypothetical protein VNZ26_30475 [Vicinamibacterales bacterium]|jgi:hypothetical protein|nr:hypothetical protein [Vicinamibacterales bacterium]